MGWNCSRGLGQAGVGDFTPPKPSRFTPPMRPGWLRECRDQEGEFFFFLLEDLPEKCQAGSDEERNLDGER